MQDDLRKALRLEEAYELLLVERMAMTVSRQRRLVRAESAGIELSRANRHKGVIESVKAAVSRYVSDDEFAPAGNDDRVQAKWCDEVLAEIAALTDSDLPTTAQVWQQFPLLHRQRENDAADEIEHTTTALDNELVKIARELREAQAWRHNTLTEVPVTRMDVESLQAAA